MPTEERAIGRLEAEVSNLKSDVTEIKSDVKKLLAWRWKLYGMTAIVSIICAGLFEVIVSVMGGK